MTVQILSWVTPEVVLRCSMSFLVGLLVGCLGKSWCAARRAGSTPRKRALGHTDFVPITPLRRNLILALAVAAVLLGVAANIQQIRNSHADENQTKCNSEYNTLDGIARDDRDLAARQGSAAELAFWKTLREQFTQPEGSVPESQAFDDFIAALDAKIASITDTQAIRDRSRYPDPHACDDGHMDEDERSPSPTPEESP